MNADSCGLESLEFRAAAIEAKSIAPRHTELVLVQASGDVGMSFGRDIRVHAHRELRCLAKMSGARRERLKLARAFHIKEQNTGSEREIDLFGQLADSGENDLLHSLAVDLPHSLQLSAGNDIESRTKPSQHAQNRKVRVRLYRIADGVLAAPKSLVELLVAVADRRAGIHIQRSTIQLSQLGERNGVGAHVQGRLVEESLVAAVGECRRSLRRTFGFHFFADVPFTLM